MAKIFRKARQDYLGENRALKYLKYALGEVVLVVIGILIALSINNWNTNRKQEQNLTNIFSLIIEDIENDTLKINAIVESYAPYADTIGAYLGGSIDVNQFLRCRNCFTISMNINPFEQGKTGFNLLKNISSDFSEDTLVIAVIQRMGTLSLLEDISAYIEIAVSQNLEHWRDTYAWYPGFITRTNFSGFLGYVDGPEFKSRLAHNYLLIYTNYVPGLQQAKTGLKELAEDIMQWKVDHGYRPKTAEAPGS